MNSKYGLLTKRQHKKEKGRICSTSGRSKGDNCQVLLMKKLSQEETD